MLEKNEKFILKQVDEAKDCFDKMIQEMRALANTTMKRIFSKQTEPSQK
jgi:hypothetical protein